MGTLRLILRIFFFFAITLSIYPFYIVGMLLTCWSSKRLFRFRSFVISIWAKLIARLIGMKIEIEGKAPPLPFMIVSNHLSYVDIVLLLSCVPAWFISKAEVAKWPVIGLLCRTAHTLFLDRGNKRDLLRLNDLIQEKIDREEAVLFFPEGTSTEGNEVKAFKTSLFKHPSAVGLPVHTVTVSYETPPGEIPARMSVCWWGDMDFGPHVLQLLRMKGFKATVRFGATPMTGADRKELSLACHADIASRFVPVTSE